jgi:soluble lytic murein transglycosylase
MLHLHHALRIAIRAGAVAFGCGLIAASPQVPSEADLWLMPAPTLAGTPALGTAVSELDAGRADRALPSFARATTHPILGGYARLYQGRAEFLLNRYDAAIASAKQVAAAFPNTYLGESALWLLADAGEAAGRWADVAQALRAITDLAQPSNRLALAHLRLGRASVAVGDTAAARRAFSTVYYGHPISSEAAEAEAELTKLKTQPVTVTTVVELERAEQLFAGRRYGDARRAYDRLVGRVSPEEATLVELRRAECDFHLRRFEQARSALAEYLDADRPAVRRVEAEYFYLSAVRSLGRGAEYLDLVRAFVDRNPTEPLAETALNDLATYHILANADDKAEEAFEEILTRFPAGAFADRASWRVGWWAYRAGEYEKAAATFESAAVMFPRADYRPSWLYWAARCHERLGHPDVALAGYKRTIAFYRNSYYGRQAAQRADALQPRATVTPMASAGRGRMSAPPAVSTARLDPGPRLPERVVPLIRALLTAELFEDAIAELRWTARQSGTSPFIEATIAYALNRQGELRPAITAMRRAYPGFMAEGGEALPTGILKVIFPLEYWDLLRQHATLRNLDPYLVAALVAQESTFQADVQSAANAWGLMQVVPPTGRRYAARLGITRFTTRRLTDPEVNVRIGTAYFSDLLRRYDGSPAHALAAYNAGENRVDRWRAERPNLEQDEFIDDIPFPETQNYVKRILGTAEDYRLLYGRTAGDGVRQLAR